jgi:hypothetical protein
MHKMEFGPAYCKDILTRILEIFILYFSELYFVFYAFLKFIHISKILKPRKKNKKNRNSTRPAFQPTASAQRGKAGRPTGLCHQHCVGMTMGGRCISVLVVACPGQAHRRRDRGSIFTHSARVMHGVSRARLRR